MANSTISAVRISEMLIMVHREELEWFLRSWRWRSETRGVNDVQVFLRMPAHS
jgi:hypothetical protein